jgi:hypothetical protein
MSDRDTIRRAVDDRRSQLARLLDALTSELALLRRIDEVLEAPTTAGPPPSSTSPPVPPGPAPRRPTGGERKQSGRSRSGPTRAEQALEMIAARPGITPAQLGVAMGLHPQYLYRLLPQLVKAGRVRKRGRGYLVVDDAPEHDPHR